MGNARLSAIVSRLKVNPGRRLTERHVLEAAIPYTSGERTYVIGVDTKILDQIKMIEEWRGYTRALEEFGRIASDIVHENAFLEALASVRIEGATVDAKRARELIDTGEDPQTKSEREFVNYYRLLQEMDAFAGEPGRKKVTLRESDLRQFHAQIVADTFADPSQAGQYRSGPVRVEMQECDGTSTVLHTPPEALELPELMRQFLDWLDRANNRPKDKLSGLLASALAHYEFVRIHPFVDGNGRCARFLASLVLLQHGYDFRQLFCITEFYDRNRRKYSEALHSVDQATVCYGVEPGEDGNHRVIERMVFDATAWVRYFLGGLSQQMFLCRERMSEGLKSP